MPRTNDSSVRPELLAAMTDAAWSVLVAARVVLERDGIADFSIPAVAAERDVRPPSLYKHVTGKRHIEELLGVVGGCEYADALEGALDGGRDDVVVELFAAHRAFALANPQLYRLMTSRPTADNDTARAAAGRVMSALERLPGTAAARDMSWAYAHGLTMLELTGLLPAEADIDALWRDGLGALQG